MTNQEILNKLQKNLEKGEKAEKQVTTLKAEVSALKEENEHLQDKVAALEKEKLSIEIVVVSGGTNTCSSNKEKQESEEERKLRQIREILG